MTEVTRSGAASTCADEEPAGRAANGSPRRRALISYDRCITPQLDGQLVYRAPLRMRATRWTIALRWLLTIPLLIEAVVLSLAVVVTVPVAWTAAWFTGRNPFHGPYLRYLDFVARVGGYHTLLSEQFPSFALAPLNDNNAMVASNVVTLRARVLLERVALIPISLLVASVIQLGRTFVLVTCWPVAVVTGQLPESVFDAVRAMERFYLRSVAYVLMVQSEYPRDLLGERIVDPNSLSLLEALAKRVTTAPGEMNRRAQVAPAARIEWPVRISTSARKVIIASVVIGVLSSVVLKDEYQQLTRPPHYSQAWSNHYYLKLRDAIGASSAASVVFSSPNATWSRVADQCHAMVAAYRFDRHALPYPNRAQNLTLLAGVDLIDFSVRRCSAASVTHDRLKLRQVYAPLTKAILELIVFLDEIPQPGEQ